MWTEKEYVDPFMIRCLNSIAKSLKVLAHKKQSEQSSFNPEFYAIYRHYIKYVQTHPWYTKKLSVIDFYCRILNIAYRCGLTNPKLVMSCKNDYLHIKKEYENACNYLNYLIQNYNYQIDVKMEVPSNITGKKPVFTGHKPSRKLLVRLQYDPTTDNISPVQVNVVNSLVKGLCYKVPRQSLKPSWSRAAFFYGEDVCNHPLQADDFIFDIHMSNGDNTPYSIYNKQDYFKKLRGEDDE